MRIIKLILISAAVTVAQGAVAGPYYYKYGTVMAVDHENDTFSVSINSSGKLETYNIPEKINFSDNRIVSNEGPVMKPGQSVMLKFRKTGLMQGPDKNAGEKTLRGTVLTINRKQGTGILRQDRTNKLVTFRFAETLKDFRMPRPGDYVDFTYKVKNPDMDKTNIVMD